MTVEDIMTRRVITVRPETTIQEAARLMFTNRVSGLPVVDAGGRVVGIISDGDLIRRQRRPKEEVRGAVRDNAASTQPADVLVRTAGPIQSPPPLPVH